ncbi:hypothetical protein SCA6_011327 [Theobroma cacao]
MNKFLAFILETVRVVVGAKAEAKGGLCSKNGDCCESIYKENWRKIGLFHENLCEANGFWRLI